MSHENLKERTMLFALRVLDVVDALPRETKGWTIGKQLSRSRTSVAANYRAANRAKSTADFIHKMGTVEEETDETLFWLELIERSALLPADRLEGLKMEADQLLAIAVAPIRTAKRRQLAK
jgi:four helix bundle protein